MPESMHTLLLQQLVDRIKSGDRSAWEVLLGAVGRRLEQIARQMLNRSGGLRRWADSDDVLQNTVVRLMRAVPPRSGK